jgi:hypothetical protein
MYINLIYVPKRQKKEVKQQEIRKDGRKMEEGMKLEP